MRLDHLLSREAPGLGAPAKASWRIPCRLELDPVPNVDRTWRRRLARRRMLLSFERPAPSPGEQRLFADLENCTIMPTKHRLARAVRTGITARIAFQADTHDHRQDRKGTRWMPWHQESMKGVNGCDKPR